MPAGERTTAFVRTPRAVSRQWAEAGSDDSSRVSCSLDLEGARDATPSELAPATTTTVSPTTTTVPAPAVLTGTGASVVPLPGRELYVATITHDGGGNFAVWALNDALEQIDLLVNEIGPYTGRKPINLLDSETAQLSIEADGNWSVTLEPGATGVRRFGRRGTYGSGSDVLYATASKVFTITHDGESNFAVWNYTTTSSDLVVNEIDRYTGQHVLREGIVVIEADGVWTITP